MKITTAKFKKTDNPIRCGCGKLAPRKKLRLLRRGILFNWQCNSCLCINDVGEKNDNISNAVWENRVPCETEWDISIDDACRDDGDESISLRSCKMRCAAIIRIALKMVQRMPGHESHIISDELAWIKFLDFAREDYTGTPFADFSLLKLAAIFIKEQMPRSESGEWLYEDWGSMALHFRRELRLMRGEGLIK